MFAEGSSTPHNRDTNKKLVKIIHLLLEDPESVSFRKPVPHKGTNSLYLALGLGDYKKIIKKPIDLNQIRRQNNEFKYKTIEEALDDIQLCWDNCKLYNHASSEVYNQALTLQKLFWKLVQENFPEIYINAEDKLKEAESREIPPEFIRADEGNHEFSQSSRAMKDEKDEENESDQQAQEEESQSKMDEENLDSHHQEKEIKSQESPKSAPRDPIEVNLNEKPSIENIQKLTAHLQSIEDKAILEQVLEILFLYEKENLLSGGKGQMHFKVEQMHITTFYRICKIAKLEIEDAIEVIE